MHNAGRGQSPAPTEIKRMNSSMPQRRRIRLPRQAYGIRGQIFSVTVCCSDGQSHLDDESLSGAIQEALAGGTLCGHARLFAFALMPDHVHLLAEIGDLNLIDAIARWKSYTTTLFRRVGGVGPLWQRSFYDHGIRTPEDLVVAAAYIVDNPKRAGLPGRGKYAWSTWSPARPVPCSR